MSLILDAQNSSPEWGKKHLSVRTLQHAMVKCVSVFADQTKYRKVFCDYCEDRRMTERDKKSTKYVIVCALMNDANVI